jgi:methylated-DNA-protein-cysteine methyltransferase-like protein
MMSSFFEKVHCLVRQVPCGKVTSYGAIARMLEHPHAARTVGWALHSLPPSVPPASGGEEADVPPARGGKETDVPSIGGDERGGEVPWWRVLNGKGCISLSGERGANLQRELLEAEGIEFDERGCVDLDRFGWEGLPWHEVEALVRTIIEEGV